MIMTTSTALSLAARPGGTGASSLVPVLASRPRGVLHVVEVPSPVRQVVPRACRPVCGRQRRRLYVVADRPSPELVGHHEGGQRLCHRCQAHLARTEGNRRARWATTLLGRCAAFPRDWPPTSYGGSQYEVLTPDQEHLGSVALLDGPVQAWHVESAGSGVPVDRTIRVGSRERAIAVLLIARERAQLPGGRLHAVDGLTGFERDVLDLQGEVDAGLHRTADPFTGRRDGHIEAVIRQRFGISSMRYHQVLNRLLDDPNAERYAPTTVHRRRRLRDHHQRRRTLARPTATQMPA